MPAFKNPSFQDRAALAAEARQKALDRLKAKPPVDEAVMAAKREAWEAEQKILSEQRAAKAEANAAAKTEKAAVKAAETAAAKAAAELKAARLKPASA
ncbi:MAG: DUF6481 family protein, partial [Hyphomicrobium sp.]|nr:DUF6481 family protein [Hyphomicrobium sp.]